MDAKITKTRLTHMLSYDWIKVVALSAVAIFVWVMFFTMTATRITPAQQFTVFNYIGNTTLSNKFQLDYTDCFKNDLFSYEVIEANYNDLTTAKEYTTTLMEARLTTDEGDVIFSSTQSNPDAVYKDEDGEKKTQTYYDGLLSQWNYYLRRLDGEKGYFAQMEAYLNGFYMGGYENADTLNEELVENAFRARIKRTKDKRFKTNAEIEQGVRDEIVRIKKYRDALVEFYGYLDAGYVSFTTSSIQYGTFTLEGVYGINLCPNEETMGDLKNLFSYVTTYMDENGKEQYKASAKDMHVSFFNTKVESSFEYECLLYVNHVIAESIVEPIL